ncbi:MAG: F0F1 ATP synthase subunit A [Acholeplasmataceae bacterium]|nr:F0F1 ATP synthase subunit A [Acholeplasmataceae bacterium]MDD4193922.1 F0F1 ATP synthase subunit A [Acholeplasmataceae bacterium]
MDQILTMLRDIPIYFYTSLGIIAFISIFSVLISIKINQMDVRDKPGKFMTVIISFIEMMNNFIKGYIGKHWKFLAPPVITLALYVFVSNISGLVALDSPTRYTSITFSVSITAFTLIQLMGFKSMGWKHLLGIFKPLAPMAPLNIVSEFTPILSMALRLFGNIASGALLMTIIYGATGWLSIIVAPAFHLVFDIGFGLIQTMVVVMLTVIYSSMKVDESDFDIIK